MKRFVIITVGKTHSGKTTFAKYLEQKLPHSLVIDQDNHAEFINKYYRGLIPNKGPNMIKYTITQTIVDYAVNQTNDHLIICNSNRARKGRLDLLHYFQQKGFFRILVHFDIPDHVLQERVSTTKRSTAIFRSASTFEEVLTRQQAESNRSDIMDPIEGEVEHLFIIKNPEEVHSIAQKIIDIAQGF